MCVVSCGPCFLSHLPSVDGSDKHHSGRQGRGQRKRLGEKERQDGHEHVAAEEADDHDARPREHALEVIQR
jgi:hypothetical protein